MQLVLRAKFRVAASSVRRHTIIAADAYIYIQWRIFVPVSPVVVDFSSSSSSRCWCGAHAVVCIVVDHLRPFQFEFFPVFLLHSQTVVAVVDLWFTIALQNRNHHHLYSGYKCCYLNHCCKKNTHLQ